MGNIATQTAVAQPWLNESARALSHASWISGRIQTLLSHYFQPDNPAEIEEAALGDWVQTLVHVSQSDIDGACQSYLRDQPRRRPTPGDILNRARSRPAQRQQTAKPNAEGDMSKLSVDEQRILHEEVLPTARRWLADRPGMARQAVKTLSYWGEDVPQSAIERLQASGHLERRDDA